MSKTYRGSCLCGTVQFEISGDFERFFLCHCSRCRRGTGSAHAANLFSSMATIEWLSGDGRIKRYQVPDAVHSRSFCIDCGSPVPRFQTGTGALIVPAGCLETDLGMTPTAHIFFASRADWDGELEKVRTYEAGPRKI